MKSVKDEISLNQPIPGNLYQYHELSESVFGVQLCSQGQGCRKWGAGGAAAPPLPSDWGGEGGRRVPLHYEKMMS